MADEQSLEQVREVIKGHGCWCPPIGGALCDGCAAFATFQIVAEKAEMLDALVEYEGNWFKSVAGPGWLWTRSEGEDIRFGSFLELARALANGSAPVRRAIIDSRTCEACRELNGSVGTAPPERCSSPEGCRCSLVDPLE